MGQEEKESLGKLFGILQVSNKDRQVLQEQFGITTIQSLLRNRKQLIHNQQYKVCCRLVLAIDFLKLNGLRKKSTNAVSVETLFDRIKGAATSWELFLAVRIMQARQAESSVGSSLQKRKMGEGSNQGKKSEPFQKKFKAGDQYWVDTYDCREQDDDSESEVDEDKEPEEPFVIEEDSPWELDEATEEVVLKEMHKWVRLPFALYKMLFPYQRVGVAWMAGLYQMGMGGILGDEPGMGKTMQSLSYLLSMMNNRKIRNALIVCPKSNLETTWMKEASRLVPFFKWDDLKHPRQPRVVMITNELSDYQRRQVLKVAMSCSHDQPHLVIASYPQIGNKGGYKGQKKEKCFDYVVLDEAHRVKSPKCQVRLNLDKISKFSSRLMLTGTPFLNDMTEVYSLFKFNTGETVLGKERHFNDQFKKPIEKGRKPDASEHEKKRGHERTEKLKEVIKPYILMRKKEGNSKCKIPESVQFDVWTRLSPLQRKLYQDVVDNLGISEKSTNGKGNNQTWALPAIGRLRQICMHPLLELAKEDGGALKEILKECNFQDLIKQSPKLALAIDLLHMWRSQGYKVLLFSQSTKMLTIIQHVLHGIEGINACRIDGQTSQKRRRTLVEEFNSTGSLYNVMLCSIQAAGEGLTLTGANKSIIYDPAWNQARPDQAAARISRPGQTRKTECIHFITAGTVEEKMFGKQVYKGSMERTILSDIDGDSATSADAIGNSNNGFSGSQKRLFDKDDLTRLFTLDPDGVCESLDKLQQAQDGAWTKKCSTGKAHSKAVIGISQRSRVYGDKN